MHVGTLDPRYASTLARKQGILLACENACSYACMHVRLHAGRRVPAPGPEELQPPVRLRASLALRELVPSEILDIDREAR
jgi:hypothetical protein